jgi:GntR family transcriptional regulator
MVSNEQTLVSRIAAAMKQSSGSLPIYRQLANVMIELMQNEDELGSSALPSERSLATGLGISRVTVRKALDELALEGRLQRRQGARTVMGDRMQKRISYLSGFSEELRSRGIEPGQRWISRQTVLPTPTEAMALGLSGTDPIVRLVRVRLADGIPLAIERAAIPQSVLPSGDLVEDSLYALLTDLGVPPMRGVQRIRAGIMARIEAELLECSPGTPLLIVERRCFLADERPVEFTETRYNGERYDFLTELGR